MSITSDEHSRHVIGFVGNHKIAINDDDTCNNQQEDTQHHCQECHSDKLAPSVSREQAEDAISTLLAWAGDNPSRSGLLETPARVVKAFKEWFAGYEIDASELLSKQFDEVAGYHAPVMLKDIPFHSRCEHHLAPIIGKAHIAYIPNGKVVGISKLARVTEAFALRLQIQERLTAQIADCIADTLQASGVAVVIEAEHFCMTTRGVNTHGTNMITSHLTGVYRDNPQLRAEFMQFCSSR
jgi:GTP cyclohydrolase I